MFYFGEEVHLDFNEYSKASFQIRKNHEFKPKDFKPIISIKYYSDTLDVIDAKIIFKYYSRKKNRLMDIKYPFKITNGEHIAEFKIPIYVKQLNSIEINIFDYKSNDDRYMIRFDNISFMD